MDRIGNNSPLGAGAKLETIRRDVPCGACRQCCYHEHVLIHPELGDDPAQYRTTEIQMDSGRIHLALAKRADGACVYLGVGGCTIHDRAPATCRRFDCKLLYERLAKITPAATLEAFIKRSPPLQVGKQRATGVIP